jgi:hypothetical protein
VTLTGHHGESVSVELHPGEVDAYTAVLDVAAREAEARA